MHRHLPIVAIPLIPVLLGLASCGLGTANLRSGQGGLAPCADRHCVSSLERDPKWAIEPLRYTGSQDEARRRLLATLRELPRCDVIADTPDYIYAQVTTFTMRFIDDVEFLFSHPGVIEVRSSSRIGYYDFGANRDRVELIRASFSDDRPAAK